MQTGRAQVVRNYFGGGYLLLPLLNSCVLWKHSVGIGRIQGEKGRSSAGCSRQGR